MVCLLADESLDAPIVVALRAAGWTVDSIAELDPGLNDDAVLALAVRDGAVLVTADKDFGDLVFRHGRPHAGVVPVRLTGLGEEAKAHLVAAVLDVHRDRIARAFTVIDPSGVRIRPGA